MRAIGRECIVRPPQETEIITLQVSVQKVIGDPDRTGEVAQPSGVTAFLNKPLNASDIRNLAESFHQQCVRTF
jgi:hypothetical protein